MKIDELAPWTSEQQAQTKKPHPANFGNWLGESEDWVKEPNWQQLISPTQQSTGDEYYWQHQTQLQQSRLHFDALPQENRQQQPIMDTTETSIFATTTKQEPTALMEERSQLNDLGPYRENYDACAKKFAPLIHALIQALEQSTLPLATSNKKTTQVTNNQDNSIKWVNESLNRRIQFKNNHLFIQGEHAELTLNLHSCDKKEQKKLIQLIQNHLKQKGLVLSRLIINGVNND
ncbi:hypothetical protein [Legionella drancourtii]|uniref:Uncharacterized protein n=1 Tax=Legionella drancourtii LLAP12 TaxID=658187 RepID=G9EQX5_9GAMM|nr:hypothetical protein [Legionella drancourtii]EHL30346.1 hypothetical protein LDG_7679 [Legionella drancourtii LLAP12]